MNDSVNVTTLEVRKDDWAQTRIVNTVLPTALAENEVILKVNRQAITANNISYAGAGEALGYWGFFPAEEGWGRIPAMGWADVIASAHPDVATGERVWGFFPFSTHLKILAQDASGDHFTDGSAHRAQYAPVYARFDRASKNPVYEEAREDQDSLLRGLFMTSWLVEDFLNESDGFDAAACLITSASSKTSIALGSCIKQRGRLRSVGLTSKGNVDFCNSLGCYDQVVCYDDIAAMDNRESVVMVDMAGNANLLRTLHEHYRDNMRYSCSVGATHYQEMGPVDDLPGAQPEFFFAPSHIQSRSADIGAAQLMAALAGAYLDFRRGSDSWLHIERSFGPESLERVYRSVLTGKASPSSGQIVSMWPADT